MQARRRKLISLSGFYGFYTQLKPGEILIFEHWADNVKQKIVLEQIVNSGQFERVYYIDGFRILGFWAVSGDPIKAFSDREISLELKLRKTEDAK